MDTESVNLSVNGSFASDRAVSVKPARGRKSSGKSSTTGGQEKPDRKAARQSSDLRKVERWGTRYVLCACALSSCLNAWANVDMCQADSMVGQASAAALGAVVPVLVWMLGKIAGHAWRANRRIHAYAVGAAGVGLLTLSIWHCGHAIALLTGSNLFLAGLLAIGIDYGLVASEIASVLATQE